MTKSSFDYNIYNDFNDYNDNSDYNDYNNYNDYNDSDLDLDSDWERFSELVTQLTIIDYNDYSDNNDYNKYNDYRDSDLGLNWEQFRFRLRAIKWIRDLVTELTITDKLRNFNHDIEE